MILYHITALNTLLSMHEISFLSIVLSFGHKVLEVLQSNLHLLPTISPKKFSLSVFIDLSFVTFLVKAIVCIFGASITLTVDPCHLKVRPSKA